LCSGRGDRYAYPHGYCHRNRNKDANPNPDTHAERNTDRNANSNSHTDTNGYADGYSYPNGHRPDTNRDAYPYSNANSNCCEWVLLWW